MIEQKQSGAVILQDGENIQETIKMSLDLESVNSIMQILSKNLYSDAIGSTIRETCSNALDSHRAAGVTDRPIIVTFGRTGSNYEFTVEDFGVGLDHDDVVNVISKYGKSLKRLSDTQLGMFGLGWKAPLAYVSSFTFIIRKNGIERKYIMSEGEEENIIDLIDEDSTESPNGVKIIVPVSSYDVNSFFTKIKEQLCYFESIYFEVKYNGNTIDNSFKITRYDDFQMSELATDNQLHLCLDNVYYPLDFKKIEISPISTPVALRFGLSDGIFPTPNREAIRYTTDAKEIIMEKIRTVASKLIEIHNKSVEDIDDFNKLITYYSGNRRYIDIGHKQNVEITDLVKYSNIILKEPQFKGISLLDMKKIVGERDEIFSEYGVKYSLSRGRIKERKHIEYMNFGHTQNDTIIYKFADRLGGIKKDYIRYLSHRGYVYFVKKERARKLFPEKAVTGNYYDKKTVSYYTLLGLHIHPKSEWRARIKEFQLIKEILTKNIIDIDVLDIPKAWLDSRKAARVTVKLKKNGHQKLEGEVSCKRAERLEKYVSDRTCKFTSFSIDLAKIQQTNMFYIYTSHDDFLKLDRLFESIAHQTVTLITFSERELKKVNELTVHNLISYENFMKGKTAMFRRIVTAYLINVLKDKNRQVFNNKSQIEKVSSDLAAKINDLDAYVRKNHTSGATGEIYTAMVDVAVKYSLFDHSVYEKYLDVKNVLDRFPFLELIYRNMSGNQIAERDRIIIDLLKYNKYKVNLELYEKKEEAKEELTETVNI